MESELTINLKVYPQLQGAKSIDDIACQATLIAGKIVPPETTTEEASTFTYKHYNYDCDRCPMNDNCLCMKLNE